MGWDGMYLRSLVLKEHRQSDANNGKQSSGFPVSEMCKHCKQWITMWCMELWFCYNLLQCRVHLVCVVYFSQSKYLLLVIGKIFFGHISCASCCLLLSSPVIVLLLLLLLLLCVLLLYQQWKSSIAAWKGHQLRAAQKVYSEASLEIVGGLAVKKDMSVLRNTAVSVTLH